MNGYLRNLSIKSFLNRSFLIAFVLLVFCAAMFYLVAWSPSVDDLIDPNRTINLRLIEFMQQSQLIFLALAIISLIFAVTIVLPKRYRLIYRVFLASVITIVSCIVIFSRFFAPAIGDNSHTLQAIDLIDQVKVDGVDYTLVRLDYIDIVSAFYVMIYRCDDNHFNCRALYSYSVSGILSLFEDAEPVFRLQLNDAGELVLLEDDLEIWFLELSE